MAAHVQSQVRALAQAVGRAFAAADLTPEELQPAGIALTQFDWQVPPLLTSLTLGGDDLSMYFDQSVTIDQGDLMRFWKQTLQDAWHQPGRLIQGGTYRGLASALRTSKVGQRVFRFAQPPGYPNQLDLKTGVMLSLEVAHTAFVSLPIRRQVITTDDYFVEMGDGTLFGVQNGRPIIDSPWEYDARSEVLDMLEAPRGPVSKQCLYDQIASLRSVLHSHPQKFRHDFAGLDQALQALRYLSWGAHCPDLVTAVQVAPTDTALLRLREQLVSSAIEVMGSNRLNDRQKLNTILDLLVPQVIGMSRFKQQIHSVSGHFPFAMVSGKEAAICEWLRTYYETEIPCSLRRNQ